MPLNEWYRAFLQSKHLKGQLDPPVRDVTFFNHGGGLDPPVSDVTFFNHGGRFGPRVSDVTVGAPLVFHDFWLVSMIFQGSFMVFGWFI